MSNSLIAEILGTSASILAGAIQSALTPKPCSHPKLPNIADDVNDYLYDKGLTMGSLILGRPGVGKTAWMAGHRVDYDARHPNDASWSLDKNGSYTDDYLATAVMRPEWAELRKRIKYIRLGDPRFAVPMPLFSPLYGNSYEEQVQRAARVFDRLMGSAAEINPTAQGNALKAILPHLLRLITSMAYVRPTHEPYQITEAQHFIENLGLMRRAMNKVGESLDYTSRQFLDNRFMNQEKKESEFRSYALTPIFSDIGVVSGVSHLGADRPTIIPHEVNEKGWIVLVDGSRITAQKSLQDILMTHLYSLIMEDVVARIPHYVPNKVAIIVDEVRAFLKIPGMAEDVGEISQMYRSRGVQFYLVIQNPRGQLDEQLLKNIWSLGNIVCFGLLDKQDCLDVGLQLSKYDPRLIKQPAITHSQNPTTEPVQGQDRILADWVSTLGHREMVMRRYYSEQKPDPYIRHIRKNKDVPMLDDRKKLEDLKDELLRENALPVSEVVGMVSRRLKELEPTPTAPRKVNE